MTKAPSPSRSTAVNFSIVDRHRELQNCRRSPLRCFGFSKADLLLLFDLNKRGKFPRFGSLSSTDLGRKLKVFGVLGRLKGKAGLVAALKWKGLVTNKRDEVPSWLGRQKKAWIGGASIKKKKLLQRWCIGEGKEE